MSVIATARTLPVEKPGNSAVATLPRPDAACAALSGRSAPLSRRSRARGPWSRAPGKAAQGRHARPERRTKVPRTLVRCQTPYLGYSFSFLPLFFSFPSCFPPVLAYFLYLQLFLYVFFFFLFPSSFFSSSSLLLLLPAAAAVVAAVAAAAAATRLKTRLKGARRPEKGGSSATHRGKAAQGCHTP